VVLQVVFAQPANDAHAVRAAVNRVVQRVVHDVAVQETGDHRQR